MEENIYAPPVAELKEVIRRTPRPKTAILAAALFDFVLTILMTTLIGIGYGVYLATQGASPAEIQEAAQGLQVSGLFRTTMVILGGLISVAAGYLCARIAVSNVYRNALISALLLTLVTRLIRLSAGLTPLELALSAMTIAAYLSGAWLQNRRTRRSEGGSGEDA